MRSNTQSLAEVIKELLKNYRLDEKVAQANLQQHWEQWMGATVNKYTHDIKLKDKKLFLRIDSSVIKNEFLYSKQTVIQNLNKELGADYISELILL